MTYSGTGQNIAVQSAFFLCFNQAALSFSMITLPILSPTHPHQYSVTTEHAHSSLDSFGIPPLHLFPQKILCTYANLGVSFNLIIPPLLYVGDTFWLHNKQWHSQPEHWKQSKLFISTFCRSLLYASPVMRLLMTIFMQFFKSHPIMCGCIHTTAPLLGSRGVFINNC